MPGMTTSPQLRESPATANFHESAAAGRASEARTTISNLGMAAMLSVGMRIERVAETVADDVERGDGEEDGQAGKEHQPPGVFDVRFGGAEDRPPRRRRQRHAQAEEGERGLGEDGRSDAETGGDEDRRERVRQEVAEDDARVAGAAGARRLRELHLPNA